MLADTRGMSSVEFTMVAVVFLLFVFGIIDFSRALWEWNSAAKATQMGVRWAVVNDPVAVEVGTFNGLTLVPPVGQGAPIPVADFNGGNPVICSSAGGTATCDSGFTADPNAFAAVVARMQDFYGEIGPDDVEVEYIHTGLGFSGNPFGSDIVPAVTVKLQPRQFDFLTPGITGLISLTMPDFAATLTAEDMKNTP
jgi:hypothetical protein